MSLDIPKCPQVLNSWGLKGQCDILKCPQRVPKDSLLEDLNTDQPSFWWNWKLKWNKPIFLSTYTSQFEWERNTHTNQGKFSNERKILMENAVGENFSGQQKYYLGMIFRDKILLWKIFKTKFEWDNFQDKILVGKTFKTGKILLGKNFDRENLGKNIKWSFQEGSFWEKYWGNLSRQNFWKNIRGNFQAEKFGEKYYWENIFKAEKI